jgi:hypothetical protein
MSRRIEGGVSPQLNTNISSSTSTAAQAQSIPSVREQMVDALFRRTKPRSLDEEAFPELAEVLAMLRRFARKLAVMAGDDEGDYRVTLVESGIAMVDEHGEIGFGAGFLASQRDRRELLIGVLAHEIGHRPKRWAEYKVRRELDVEELQALCRHEETRADIFSGKGLAELSLSCDPLCNFLLATETATPHPEYHPADVRAEVIRDAHAGRAYRVENRRKLFPEFDRARSVKNNLGEY